MHAYKKNIYTTEVVKVLLSNGARPEVIPRHMWENYIEQPQPGVNKDSAESLSSWCTSEHQVIIAMTLNLSQRYFLARASQQPELSKRRIICARKHESSGLFEIPYYLIGQAYSINLLQERIITHLVSSASK